MSFLTDVAAIAAAEEQDRREWIEGISRRLGLVAEVHRCCVRGPRLGFPGWYWGWVCLRPDCPAGDIYCMSWPTALTGADAHTRAYLPELSEETPFTELDLLAYDAAWARMRAQQDAFAAALPERVAEVTGEINAKLAGAGLLPEGMRFEWVTGGE